MKVGGAEVKRGAWEELAEMWGGGEEEENVEEDQESEDLHILFW